MYSVQGVGMKWHTVWIHWGRKKNQKRKHTLCTQLRKWTTKWHDTEHGSTKNILWTKYMKPSIFGTITWCSCTLLSHKVSYAIPDLMHWIKFTVVNENIGGGIIKSKLYMVELTNFAVCEP